MTSTAFERIVLALEQHSGRVTGGGNRRQAKCPAHNDGRASLSLTGIDGQALLYCHAGCDTAAVLDAIGLGLADLFDTPKGASYAYLDGRHVHRTPNKRFRQSGNTAGNALYRLDRVKAAVTAGQTVYVVEGEKDVHALESLDATATCSAMGAGKAHKADWTPLAGAIVVIVTDRDEPGHKHAGQVREILTRIGATVTTVHAKAGKDAADHLAAGYGLDELVPWQGKHNVHTVHNELTRAVTRRLSNVEPEQIAWLWPGRLARGKIHIIDGDPGLGKSTIAYDLAARLSTGSPWPDGALGSKAGAVILSAEDGLADTIRPRLNAHSADCDRITALTEVSETDPDTGQVRHRLPDLTDLGPIRSAIDEVDAALLIIDPLSAYLPRGVDAFKDADVRRALTPLAAMAERLGVAVVIIRHLRKTGGKAIYAGGGSIGIIGAARVGFVVASDPSDENRSVFAVSKVNIAVKSPALAYRLIPDVGCARVQWEGTIDVSADDLTAERDRGDDGERDALDSAVDWLLGYLEDEGGSASWKDVRKAGQANGHTDRTLQRAKQRAKVGHWSGGFPRSTVWTHPQNTDSANHSRASTVGANDHGVPGVTEVASGNGRIPSPVASARHPGATGIRPPATDSQTPCDRVPGIAEPGRVRRRPVVPGLRTSPVDRPHQTDHIRLGVDRMSQLQQPSIHNGPEA